MFQIPASMPAATYFVDVAVFNGTWSTMYIDAWYTTSFAVTP